MKKIILAIGTLVVVTSISFGGNCEKINPKYDCFSGVVDSFADSDASCDYYEFKSRFNKCSNKTGEINEYDNGLTPLMYLYNPFGFIKETPEKYKALNLLISKGADVNLRSINSDSNGYGGSTVLHFLVMKSIELEDWSNPKIMLKEMKILIKNGADVNKKNQKGQSPLFYALGKSKLYPEGTLKVAKLLIKNGASITLEDDFGNTAIHDYITENTNPHPHVLDYFFNDKGIDINIRGNYQKTLLHKAAEKSDLIIVKYLISNKANINAKDREKRTPLHSIARSFLHDKSVNVAKLLISKGADVNSLDKKGNSVLDYLYKLDPYSKEGKRGKKKLIKFIKSEGGV